MFLNSKIVQFSHGSILRGLPGIVRRSLLVSAVVVMLLAIAVPATVMAAPADAPADAPSHYSFSYQVKKGDSLSKVARRYGITVYALAHANGLSTTSYLYVGQHLYIPKSYGAATCKSYYYVKHGDTLSGVASWYGINTYALARANNLSNASYIYTGQRICIPSVYGTPGHSGNPSHYGYHTVTKGQTLSWIAKHYGVGTYSLQHANGISNANHIYVGQVLKIPRY